MSLPEHIQRVVNEQKELEQKHDSLGSFFGTETFVSLPPHERSDLKLQFYHMNKYLVILTRRITRFRALNGGGGEI
jgi:hypothetical protein